MCFECDGYNEFSSRSLPVARKAHRCEECGDPINPGEQYSYWSFKYDGHLGTFKSCRRCEYDRFRVAEHELAEGCGGSEIWCPFGELQEYLRDSEMGITPADQVPASYQLGSYPERKAGAA